MKQKKDFLDKMLSYYEIDTGSNLDELPPKQALRKMINNIFDNYERQIIKEIIKENRPPEMDEDIPMDDALGDEFNEPKKDKDMPPDFEFFKIDPETERFIFWISDVLYSADHNVTVTKSEDGNTITINLVKINNEKGS